MSCKATPYARRHGSGGISTSAKSLPQPCINSSRTKFQEEEEIDSGVASKATLESEMKSSPSRRYSRSNFRKPPFSKAFSLDYDDGGSSHYTYCSMSSSKQTTVRIENDSYQINEDDTSEDEDTDEALMVSATESTALPLTSRMRTVSTVSECSEFSTCH